MPGTTDTVKAMLTPGEFVIRKEAVDMIGVPILEKLNDMPEAGGHSEIDRLIAMATLKNMTGMYGGGMVNAKQYMGGGKVDMYGHGGKVKNQMMMGYEHGGEAHGNLKPVPDDNPGLAKLPKAVRNKMGYMQDGGSVSDATATNLIEMLYEQSLPTQNNYGSLQDQDRIDLQNQEILDMITGSAGAVGSVVKPGKKAIEKFLKEYFNLPFTPKFNKTLPKIDFKGSPLQRAEAKAEFARRKNIEKELDLYEDIPNISQSKIQNAIELEDAGDMIDILRKRGLFASGGLVGMMYGGKAKKKKKYGYQEGGSVDSSASNYLNYILETTPPDTMKSIMETGFRTAPKELFEKASAKTDSLINAEKERQKMLMEQYPELFQENQEPVKKGFLKKLLGMQEGGAVQDSSMMMQANPFIPFDQRPPSSGEMMSPIPSGMEQGDMMRIIRDEREVLDMQDVELLRKKAQNALTRFQLDSLMEKATLDSLINQGSGDAMRIERSPNEPFFFPNTPAQENFMQKYKEEMIDPTYFPEGN